MTATAAVWHWPPFRARSIRRLWPIGRTAGRRNWPASPRHIIAMRPRYASAGKRPRRSWRYTNTHRCPQENGRRQTAAAHSAALAWPRVGPSGADEMKNAISFDAIRHVRLGPSHSAVIAGADVYGEETEVFLKTADIPAVVTPLLCCAAAESTRSPPPAGTIIPGCHLPVAKWRTGRSKVNGHPLLILEVAGGSTLVFQFSADGAQQCGQALMGAGTAVATPASEAQASQSPPVK